MLHDGVHRSKDFYFCVNIDVLSKKWKFQTCLIPSNPPKIAQNFQCGPRGPKLSWKKVCTIFTNVCLHYTVFSYSALSMYMTFKML